MNQDTEYANLKNKIEERKKNMAAFLQSKKQMLYSDMKVWLELARSIAIDDEKYDEVMEGLFSLCDEILAFENIAMQSMMHGKCEKKLKPAQKVIEAHVVYAEIQNTIDDGRFIVKDVDGQCYLIHPRFYNKETKAMGAGAAKKAVVSYRKWLSQQSSSPLPPPATVDPLATEDEEIKIPGMKSGKYMPVRDFK